VRFVEIAPGADSTARYLAVVSIFGHAKLLSPSAAYGRELQDRSGSQPLPRIGADYRERRELIIERVRRVTIGDASLTLLLNDGTMLERSIERIRHGNDAKLIVGELAAGKGQKADPQLIVLLKDARRAQRLALAKPTLSLDQLARLFGRSTERYKRLLRLSYLSPTIVQAIINGQQPGRVTNRFLQNLDGLPLGWVEQGLLLR
jgi:hypothetical protein